MENKKFIGEGYWHNKKNWNDCKLPEWNDVVILDEECKHITIGYDKNSLKYKFHTVINIITLGKFKRPIYKVFFREMTIKTNGTVTIHSEVKMINPFIYRNGNIDVLNKQFQ